MQHVAGATVTLTLESPFILGLPEFKEDESVWNMPYAWRRPYVAVKHSVAKSLQPRRILEIGVYSGIAALSFLAAVPDAEYVGIDNLDLEKSLGIEVVSKTKEKLDALGYKNTIIVGDSQQLSTLPDGPYDLIHVDGCHSKEAAQHDVTLAWNALTPSGHMLIDNGHDASVCAGTFLAMRDALGGRLFSWSYLEESVGNILIRKEPL